MSKRNFATSRSTTTQSSNRPRKVPTRIRPTCVQTETSSLSTPNVSVARVLFQPYFTSNTSQRNPRHFFPNCDVDIRKESYANVVLSNGTTMFQRLHCFRLRHSAYIDRRKVQTVIRLTYSQTETPSLSAMNLFAARKCCSSQISLVKKPVATLISASICTPMSCRQAA